MQARKVILATIYVAALSLQALSAPHAKAAGIPEVVVTLPAVHPLVVAVMRGAAKPKLLTQPHQDPHTMMLTPRQMAMLEEADVLIVADRGMNAPLIRRMEKAARKTLTVIALTELPGADPKPYRTENAYSGHTRKDEGGLDPHVWLDPLRMAKMLPALATKLGETMPYASVTLSANAEALSLHLRNEVHPALQERFASVTRAQTPDVIPYLPYHDAFQYFQNRYDLTSYGFVTQSPEEHLGAAAMQALLEASRNKRIHCLLTEGKSPLTTRLQLMAEAKLVMLSPEQAYDAKAAPNLPWAQNDYDRLLGKTADIFAGCLQGDLAR